MKVVLSVIAFVAVLIVFSIFFVYAGDVATFEANVIGPSVSVPIVRISVPDYIFLGNVTKGEMGDATKVIINNTGNTNVSVTPMLVDSSDKLFENIYFTKRLSGKSYEYKKIGRFSLWIAAPSSSGVRSDYVYASLNLSNYADELPEGENLMRADVRFVAVAD